MGLGTSERPAAPQIKKNHTASRAAKTAPRYTNTALAATSNTNPAHLSTCVSTSCSVALAVSCRRVPARRIVSRKASASRGWEGPGPRSLRTPTRVGRWPGQKLRINEGESPTIFLKIAPRLSGVFGFLLEIEGAGAQYESPGPRRDAGPECRREAMVRARTVLRAYQAIVLVLVKAR